MLDAYASIGMPLGYNHWSFGKHFVESERNYQRGYMGLAYEIVINSNPCIAYLMEENTMTMQALVDRACVLWAQLVLQEQLSVSHVDRCEFDHRLPRVREAVHQPVRRAPWRRRSREDPRFVSCADDSRGRPLQTPATRFHRRKSVAVSANGPSTFSAT